MNFTNTVISLTDEGVERHFYGDVQKTWDVYAVTRSYNVYVPQGKKLICETKGLYRDASVDEVFADVYCNAWYTDAIQWVNEKGYLVGMTEKSFSPSGELTRAQFVSILSRIVKADLGSYKRHKRD